MQLTSVGNLTTEEAVLEWLKELKASEEIEAVSDQVTQLMIEKCEYLAVLFCEYLLIISFFFLLLDIKIK